MEFHNLTISLVLQRAYNFNFFLDWQKEFFLQKAVGPPGERQSTGDGESSWLTCSCLPGHVYSIRDNQCYREFTQVPANTPFIVTVHLQKQLFIDIEFNRFQM